MLARLVAKMMLVCTLIIFLLSFASECYEQLGAPVGLPTSIPCNGIDIIESPPFWMLNGTVYELFSIPRHFPFISVTDLVSLHIPIVEPVLNHTTFQCARFGENGLENGTVVQLQVFLGDHCSVNTSESELVLNYQELYIQDNRTTFSWVLNDTCSERYQVQGYTLDTREPVLSPEHVFDVGLSASVVLALDSNISYKLVAFGDNESLCSSNRDIYYKFQTSTKLKMFDFSFDPPPCIAIPQIATSCPRKALNFVWPARTEGRSCVCPVHNSSAGRRVFESCVEGCRDALLTPTLTEEGKVCVATFRGILNGSLFHFVCFTDECGGGNPCFLQTLTASYSFEITQCEDFFTGTYSEKFDEEVPISTYSEQFLTVIAALSSSVAILESVVIALLCLWVLKSKKQTKMLKACKSSNTTSSLPPSNSPAAHDAAHDPCVHSGGSAPEYEEIPILGKQDSKHTLGEVYKLTTCPAYAHSSPQ